MSDYGAGWNDTDRGVPTDHNATLSTINPTWTALEMNIGLHNDKPATNYCARARPIY
jgi:hypothetical protein